MMSSFNVTAQRYGAGFRRPFRFVSLVQNCADDAVQRCMFARPIRDVLGYM